MTASKKFMVGLALAILTAVITYFSGNMSTVTEILTGTGDASTVQVDTTK